MARHDVVMLLACVGVVFWVDMMNQNQFDLLVYGRDVDAMFGICLCAAATALTDLYANGHALSCSQHILPQDIKI